MKLLASKSLESFQLKHSKTGTKWYCKFKIESIPKALNGTMLKISRSTFSMDMNKKRLLKVDKDFIVYFFKLDEHGVPYKAAEFIVTMEYLILMGWQRYIDTNEMITEVHEFFQCNNEHFSSFEEGKNQDHNLITVYRSNDSKITTSLAVGYMIGHFMALPPKPFSHIYTLYSFEGEHKQLPFIG